MRRRLGPYENVKVIDLTRLHGDVQIFAVKDAPLEPYIEGKGFRPWKVKIRLTGSLYSWRLALDNGGAFNYSRPGGCVRIEADEGTIAQIKSGQLPIPRPLQQGPQEYVVQPGLPFRRPDQDAPVSVKLHVAPGMRVLY